LSLIQTISVTSTSDSTYSSKDLSNAFSLLLYTTPVVTNSYKFNDNIGRQSSMLSKKLYNPVNGQKGIDSNIIVSYSNINGRYDFLKDSLKKSIILAVGRIKLNPIKQYATMTFQDSNKRRKTGLFASLTKNSSNNLPTVNFPNLVNQTRPTYLNPNLLKSHLPIG
ncbi:24824_t:CDS:2, partial [Gigaspora margarita]